MSAQENSYEVKAGLETFESFDVVGVSVVTDNQSGTDDINALWERFFKESVGTKVENKIDDVIYAVYSDYEGDHEAPYRYTIGYKVAAADDIPQNVPENMTHTHVQTQEYAMMSAAGAQPQALIETWSAIWQSDLDRSFKTDFEIYGPRFFEDGINEVIVAIGLNGAQSS